MTNSGYALFTRPNAWLRDKPMTVRLVYDAIASLVDVENDGIVEISLRDLMEMTRRARRTVLRAVKRLTCARLLVDRRTRVGRGAIYAFRVSAFHTNPKHLKKRPQTQTHPVVQGYRDWSFPQEKVPPYIPYSQENLNPTPLKTPESVRLSPGRIMGLSRKTIDQNPHLSQEVRESMLSALGRMVFKLGYLAELQDFPCLLDPLLAAMRHPQPLGVIPSTNRRRLFAAAMALMTAVIARHSGRLTQKQVDHLANPYAAGMCWAPSRVRAKLNTSAPPPARSEPKANPYDAREYERRTDNRRRRTYNEQLSGEDTFSLIGETLTCRAESDVSESTCGKRHKTHIHGVEYGAKTIVSMKRMKLAGSTGRALSSPTRGHRDGGGLSPIYGTG